MRKSVCLMLVVLLVAVAVAKDADLSGAAGCLGEGGGALLGGVLVGTGAALVLGCAGFAVDRAVAPNSYWGGLEGLGYGVAAGAALGYPLGCGLGTTLAGQALCEDGNVGAAYAGAYAGLAVGVLLGWAVSDVGVVPPVTAVLSPAGAVLGYNLVSTRERDAWSFMTRVVPPIAAFSTPVGPGRQRYSAFDCRLVTVRF